MISISRSRPSENGSPSGESSRQAGRPRGNGSACLAALLPVLALAGTMIAAWPVRGDEPPPSAAPGRAEPPRSASGDLQPGALAQGDDLRQWTAAASYRPDGRPVETPPLDVERFWSAAELEPSQFPGALEDAELRALWARALDSEFSRRLRQSSDHYLEIAKRRPDSSLAFWRAARNYWRLGDATPDDQREAKVRYFEQSEALARHGMEIDPECAACMLFRAGALGRLATTRGIASGARSARTIAELLDRAIALEPSHTDGDQNSTLGNLYYASSTFYRTVPDWRVVEWLIGVRGDKERALRDIRKAVEISDRRIDYRVELGAALLCLGSTKSDPARVAEGIEVLDGAQQLELLLDSDTRDLVFARAMVEAPEKACGFSRDGFVDANEARRAF